MPRHWRKAKLAMTCGYAGCAIATDAPFQEIRIGAVTFVRCELHADGPVNWDEMQAAESKPAYRPSVERFKRLAEGMRFDPKLAQTGERE